MKKILSVVLMLSILISAFSFVVSVSAADYDTSQFIERKGWTIKTSCHKKPYNGPLNLVDGRTDTFWHSDYVEEGGVITSHNEPPYEINVTLPEPATISGFGICPRTGNLTGNITGYEFYYSAEDEGEWYFASKGTFANDWTPKYVRFDKNITVKNVRFVITSSHNGYGVLTEFDLLSRWDGSTALPDGSTDTVKLAGTKATDMISTTISRKGWKVTASDYKSYNHPANMVDGRSDTYWHSDYEDDGTNITSQVPCPHEVVIEIPEATNVSALKILPRSGNPTGLIKAYEVHVSENDTETWFLVKSGTLEENYDEKIIEFGKTIKAKKVRLTITESNKDFAAIAEINLEGEQGTTSDTPSSGSTSEKPNVSESTTESFVKKAGWKAEISSEYHQNPGKYAIDGNAASFWHTYYKAEGSNIVDYAALPHSLTVTLPETTVISGFAVTPRSEAGGRITEYELYGAVGNGELELMATGTLANKADTQIVEFPGNIAISKVMLKATATHGGKYCAIAEFELLKESKEKETISSFKELYGLIDGETLVSLPKTEFSATATSGENSAMFAIDGMGTSTSWHSDANKQHDFPITYSVDMGDVYTLSYLQYSPRGGDAEMIGYWTDFDIFVSADGVDYEQVVSHGTVELTQNKISLIEFSKTSDVRYIDIEIYDGNHGYAVCGELDFLVPKKEIETRKKNNYYKLQIGSNTVTTVKNGIETVKEIDVAPYIMNGSTLIPLRGLLEEMGAAFTWDGEHRKIGITKEKTEIEMQIFNNLVYVTNSIYGRVRYTLSVIPQIKDSRTFVPVRFISEQLGYEVVWDGETQSIYIY